MSNDTFGRPRRGHLRSRPKAASSQKPNERSWSLRLEPLERRQMLSAGSLDPTFLGDLNKIVTPIAAADDFSYGVVVQVDGKLVTAGRSWNGTNDDFALARYQPDGALDLTFDGDGRVTASVGTRDDLGRALALQPDGKIVVAGYSYNGVDDDFSVARFNPNGSLDTTFSGDGRLIVPFGTGEDRALGVALQSDGKIVLAGTVANGSNSDFAVLRLNSDGSLDTSFDGDGKVTIPNGTANAVVVQSDGRIVVAGYATGATDDFAALRLNANGALDATFGVAGRVTTPIGGGSDEAFGVALQADGKIVLVGRAAVGAQTDVGVVRYTAAGVLDTTFDGDGIATTDLAGGNDQGRGVAVQADGRLVVSGHGVQGPNNDFAVLRYKANGALDTTFGGTGRVLTPIRAGNDTAMGLALQADGRIAVAGISHNGSNNDFAIVRYLTSGVLDPTFSAGANKILTPFGSFAEGAYGVAVQSDGKLIAAGPTWNGSNYDFAVARYYADGTRDETFGVGGRVTTPVRAGDDVARAVAVQSDGKIVVVGSSFNGANDDFAVVRYLANGDLDPTFNGTGKAFFNAVSHDFATALAIQPDGKIVVAGSSLVGSYDFLVTRFNVNGTLDTGFGGSGARWVNCYGAHDFANSVVLQPDGKIIVAGQAHNGTNYDVALARLLPNGGFDVSFGPFSGVQLIDWGANETAASVGVLSDGTLAVAGAYDNGFAKYVTVQQYSPSGFMWDYAITSITGLSGTAVSAVAQPDGKLVVAGYSSNGVNRDFALLRYNTDLSLDTTFGGADGQVITAVRASDDYGLSVALQPDGKIVVAGEAVNSSGNSDFALVRYRSNGSEDTSFLGGANKITTAIGPASDAATGVVVQSDDRIVVAGYSSNGSNFDTALVRYLPDGSLDATFDSDGRVTTNRGNNEYAYAVALQADGKIVTAGVRELSGSQFSIIVSRYLPNGALDTTFSGDGVDGADLSGGDEEAFGLAIQPDGKIVVTGFRTAGNRDVVVLRYNTNGTLDSSFGSSGVVTTALSTSNDVGRGVVLQSDGKIVVVGQRGSGAASDLAIIRYNANGSLDSSFGSGGIVVLALTAGQDIAWDAAITSTGKLVVAASRTPGASADSLLLQFNANGTLDSSFDVDGMLQLPLSTGLDELYSIAAQADGKIVAAGYAHNGVSNDFAVVRVNANGSLDSSFDGDGISITPIRVGENDTAEDLAIQADGKIVLAGFSGSGGATDFAVVRYLVGPENASPQADPGGPYTIDEGQGLSLDASDSFDPDGGTIVSYSWDINGDSVYGDATGVTPTLTWAALQALGIDDGLATYNVRVRVTDFDGAIGTSAPVLLTVQDMAPSIALTGAPSVDEGSVYTLNLGAISDPGDDTVLEWHVDWGDYTPVAIYYAAGPVTHVYVDGLAAPTISVDLLDEDGLHVSTDTHSLIVNNVAPTIALSGDPSVDEGSVYTLTLGAIMDPGADTVTEWHVDWGDGSSEVAYFASGQVAHVYFNENIDPTIAVTLVDEDGTHLSAGELTINVDSIAAELVRDINLITEGSNPSDFVQLGSIVLFEATDSAHGAELWRSDGTISGTYLVKDVRPGMIGAGASELTNVGGVLYFRAYDANGSELWRSDGTSAGTWLVKDIFSGGGSSNPRFLTNVGGDLYFSATNGLTGYEVWRSDGSAAGTSLVADVRSGTSGSNPGDFTNVEGLLYFSADNGVDGRELWRSDGTSTGTYLVNDVRMGSGGSYPSSLASLSSVLYFNAFDGVSGTELWRSDGTSAGTYLVKDIHPGGLGSSPSNMTNVGGVLYFRANDGISGYELWRSSGTESGTYLVKDTRPGGSYPELGSFTNVGGTLYFSANDGVSGRELWRSDGTSSGTHQVSDIRAGGSSAYPEHLINVGGLLYFSANDGTSGVELWRSDGSSGGTFRVMDIRPGPYSSYPNHLLHANGKLYFGANDGIHGVELWRSDGTDSGTTLVEDIRTGVYSASPDGLTNVGGVLYFTALNGTNGHELWRSNGANSETSMVLDIREGFYSSFPRYLTNAGGVLYFSANDGVTGNELWRSDGTAAGTYRVSDIRTGVDGSNPRGLAAIGGVVYFTANDSVSGYELWRSDGTAAGTYRVSDIRSGASGSNPSELTNAEGLLYFSANDGASGYELWRSDGTSSGTFLVEDIRPGASGSNPDQLTNANGVLYFSANDGVRGYELWRSGVASGAHLVEDVRPGPGSSNPRYFANVSGHVYFRANDGVYGDELWHTDGHASGTKLVEDIFPGLVGSNPYFLANIGGVLYLRARDNTTGSELWRSDGTTSGTFLVKDIRPGFGSSDPVLPTNVNGVVYFRANDGMNGYELWRSDGSAFGTYLVEDIRPGTNGSYQQQVTNVDGALYFRANDGTTGLELWRLKIEAPPLADAGGAYSISEGDSLTLDASASYDPDGGALVGYAWDLDGDFMFDDAFGVSPMLAWSDLQAIGLNDGPTSYEVRVRVTDDEGETTTSSFTLLSIANTAPTATFHSADLIYGQSHSISLSDPYDPAIADVGIGFEYSFDLGAGYGPFGPSSTSDIATPNAAGVVTVRGRIRDKDGGITEYVETIDITPATLLVTADPQSKVYGGADPTLTYSANGFQLSDDAGTVLTGLLDRAAGEDVGVYAIGQGSLAGNANYVVTFIGEVLTITPTTLLVSADPQSKTYGSLDPTLTYFASGFQFSDAASGVLTGALDRLAGEDVGIYTIGQGTLAANANYSVTFVGDYLTVTPATLLVTADPQSKVYGSSDPTLTYAASGFQFSDDAGSVLTGALSRAGGENVGVYTIGQGSLAANANYSVTFTGDDLTISPATLLVSADPQNKTYGSLDPTLTYSASGFQFSDDADSVLTGALHRIAGENVGAYAVGQGTLTSNSSYMISFTGDSFTITPATLLVTADPQSKVYGGADPTLTYSASGFQFSDDASEVLTGALSRSAGEGVGVHSIGQGSLVANANYTIAFSGDGLTITPATLLVTADPQSKVYGTLDPTLTYSASGFQFSDDADTVLTGLLDRAPGEDVTGSPYAIGQGTLASNPNYSIAFTGNGLAITPATLTIMASAFDKVYDGGTTALVAFSDDRALGDVLIVSYSSADFSDPSVGANKPVTVLGLSISGPDAVNYTLSNTSAATTASILHSPLLGVVGVRFSGSASVHAPYDVPVGDGEQLRTVPVGRIDTVSITFDDDVLIVSDDLMMAGANFGPYSFVGFSYDSLTFTATWTLAEPIGPDELTLTLSDNVTDHDFGALDGDWDNPIGLDDLYASTESGNGIAGGDFEFHFTVLPGDANRDNKVTGADYTIWADKFDNGAGAADKLFTDGDYTGDGHVTGADYTLWADNYDVDQTAPPVEIGDKRTRRIDDAERVVLAPVNARRAVQEVQRLVERAPQEAARPTSRRAQLEAVDALISAEDWLQDRLAKLEV